MCPERFEIIGGNENSDRFINFYYYLFPENNNQYVSENLWFECMLFRGQVLQKLIKEESTLPLLPN